MTVQYVNTGSSPNKGDGDSLRAAFTKINNNFAEIYSITGDINTLDDTIGNLLATSQQDGLSVTYNSGTNQASFILNTATTSTLGGIKIGDNLTIDSDGTLQGYILPFASPTTVGGALTSDTIIVNGSGQFIAYPASTTRRGVVQIGDGLTISDDYIVSANLGDIVITATTITTKFPDTDIIFIPNISTSTSRIRLVNQPLQFDNGAGDAYLGHLIYTNPVSTAGIGISESNHSIRVAGDTITLGLIADFGLYNAIRGSWNSLITMDYVGNITMNDGDMVFGTVNKGIQFQDGTRQTTAFVGASISTEVSPPTTLSTGTTWYDPNSGRLYIYYNDAWVDASPASGGGGGGVTVTDRLISDIHSLILNVDGSISLPGTSITSDPVKIISDGNNVSIGGTGTYIYISDVGGAGISLYAQNSDHTGTQYTLTLNGDNGYLSLPRSFNPSLGSVGAFQSPTVYSGVASTSTGTVVYTDQKNSRSIKLLLQVEGWADDTPESGGLWDTQSCEMIIARSQRGTVASVYGLAYTSTYPMATFDAEYNILTNKIEVMCIPAITTTGTLYVVALATSIQSAD